MARETAAAKRARLESERLQEQARMALAFPSNLQVALQEATKFGFMIMFADGKLSVKNRNSRDVFQFELTSSSTALMVEFNDVNQNHLIRLECEVDYLTEQERERDRVQALREGALAKLTDAERSALGLYHK